MDILLEARRDAKMIVTEGGFELPCIFDNNAGTVIETSAQFIRRSDTLEYDDGTKKHSPFSSLTVDYDVFNFANRYVTLKGWSVTVEGELYEITESLPNRTFGIIQCNLKDG